MRTSTKALRDDFAERAAGFGASDAAMPLLGERISAAIVSDADLLLSPSRIEHDLLAQL